MLHFSVSISKYFSCSYSIGSIRFPCKCIWIISSLYLDRFNLRAYDTMYLLVSLNYCLISFSFPHTFTKVWLASSNSKNMCQDVTEFRMLHNIRILSEWPRMQFWILITLTKVWEFSYIDGLRKSAYTWPNYCCQLKFPISYSIILYTLSLFFSYYIM